jgi:hypothetical protein
MNLRENGTVKCGLHSFGFGYSTVQDLENTTMKITVPQKAGPKTSFVTISFSRTTLAPEVRTNDMKTGRAW